MDYQDLRGDEAGWACPVAGCGAKLPKLGTKASRSIRRMHEMRVHPDIDRATMTRLAMALGQEKRRKMLDGRREEQVA
eukprot:6143559-Alexandrium_andersonii.AAC.1